MTTAVTDIINNINESAKDLQTLFLNEAVTIDSTLFSDIDLILNNTKQQLLEAQEKYQQRHRTLEQRFADSSKPRSQKS